MSKIFFETDRLYYRIPTLDDLTDFNIAVNQAWPELQKWMSWAADGFNFVKTTPKSHQSFATAEWLDVHNFVMNHNDWEIR